jgi:MazG family protein
VDELLAIMAQLRDPDRGCPWDREQTFSTIAPYTIEEAYEVADAIERGDMSELREELGDLLFQVVFYCQMAREAGRFDFAQVVDAISAKMIRRHPHVFGDAEIGSAEEQRLAWERHKVEERRARDAHGVLDGVARALPALMRAEKLQRRAAKVGFDWSDAGGALAKVDEESREIGRELEAQRRDRHRLAEEVGDLLFACVNVARLVGVDAEAALSGASSKFERRFRAVEAELAARGRTPQDADLQEMDAIWERIKSREGAGDG